ncbi:hypothetical protein GE21DRAFT_1209497, partial [Neurospora crassa]
YNPSTDPPSNSEPENKLFDYRDISTNLPSSAIPPTVTIEALYESINEWAKLYSFVINRI